MAVYGIAMTDDGMARISIQGELLIPPGVLDLPATYGPIALEDLNGKVHFTATVLAPPETPHGSVIRRAQLAVEAGVAAATGTGSRAQPDLRTYSINGRPALSIATATASVVVVSNDAPGDAERRGAATAEAVFLSNDERLAELWEVYLLGLRAIETVASPVVGLWAFSTILEEDGPGGLGHAQAQADGLRSRGYLVPENPERHPQRIRTAALHSSPKDPLPSQPEVMWFRYVAEAYLLDRAAQGRWAPSKRLPL